MPTLLLLAGALVIAVGTVGTSVFNVHSINGLSRLSGQPTAVFIVSGAILGIIALLLIIGGVRVGHPSQIARWLLVIFEVLVLLGTLTSFSNAGSTSNGTLSLIIALVVEGLIIYGLAIDPLTWRAFARRH
jgi:hypothetical protein